MWSLSGSNLAFETVGLDLTMEDDLNDVWTAEYAEDMIQSYEKSENYPYIDMTKLSVEDSGENYTLTISLKSNFNKSPIFEMEDSFIHIWIDANGTSEPDKDQIFFYLDISSNYEGGFVYCVTNTSMYLQNNVAIIENNDVSWTFPKLKIDNALRNIKPILEWKITTWSYYSLAESNNEGNLL